MKKENYYLNQYRDLKIFYKENVGEQNSSPIITNDKMRTYYLIEVFGFK